MTGLNAKLKDKLKSSEYEITTSEFFVHSKDASLNQTCKDSFSGEELPE